MLKRFIILFNHTKVKFRLIVPETLVFRTFVMNIRPTGDSVPRKEIVMSSTDAKATMLVAHMQYKTLGFNGFFVDLKQITLLAANETGQIFKKLTISVESCGWNLLEYIESDDVPRHILSFIDENFEEGQVPKLAAANMDELLRYFQQSAPTLNRRLGDTPCIDLDDLVKDLPKNSLVYKDYTNGRLEEGRTVEDVLSAALFFRSGFQPSKVALAH